MFQLIYSSVPKADLTQESLKAIAAQSASRNKIKEISGVLIMSGGIILQVLEGEEHAVRDLFAKIKADPRHSDCTPLLERETSERAFSDWSLGYSNAEDGHSYEMRLIVTALKAKLANHSKLLKLAS